MKVSRLTGRTGQQVTMGVLSMAALAAVVAFGQADSRPEPSPVSPQVAVECAREDSVGCTWHADQHGDGSGLSFDVSATGVVRYWGPVDYQRYHASR